MSWQDRSDGVSCDKLCIVCSVHWRATDETDNNKYLRKHFGNFGSLGALPALWNNILRPNWEFGSPTCVWGTLCSIRTTQGMLLHKVVGGAPRLAGWGMGGGDAWLEVAALAAFPGGENVFCWNNVREAEALPVMHSSSRSSSCGAAVIVCSICVKLH